MPNHTLNAAADTDLTTKGKRLLAWHIASSSAAQVNFKDGGTGGPIVLQVNLAAGTSASEVYPNPSPIVFSGGLYVDWVSGALVGSVTLD